MEGKCPTNWTILAIAFCCLCLYYARLRALVDPVGVEPTTFRLQGGCSPKLSYEPIYNRKYHSLLCILYERALDLQVLPHLLSTYLSYNLDHTHPTVLFHTPKPCPSVVLVWKEGFEPPTSNL